MTWKPRTQAEKEKTLQERMERHAKWYGVSVTQLAALTEKELMQIPNLGKKGIRYLKEGPPPNPLEFWL
jgi:hypothetical protein